MRRSLLIFVLLLTLPTLALGQAQTTAKLSGIVTNADGDPLAGATISLRSSALPGSRTAETKRDGTFLVALLPPGEYTVAVSSEGLQSIEYNIRLAVGETFPLAAVLGSGSEFAEEVTVLGELSKLETTTVGETFDYTKDIEQLPIQNRDINRVAEYAPNVSPSTEGKESNHPNRTNETISIAGAPSFDNVVLLDGVEISDPLFSSAPTVWLEDAIQEIQVLTSGVSARYGRFQGGVINAITKSGGNSFDGAVRAELENEDWNSQTPFGETQVDDTNEVLQGTLGGYLLKDRLTFFTGLRAVPEKVESNTTNFTGETFGTTDDEDRWQAKLRGSPTQNQVIEYSHLDFDRQRLNRAGLPAGDARASTGQRLDPRTTDALFYQAVVNQNLFVDAQATRKNVEIASGGDPALGDPFLDLASFQVFHNHWWDVTDPNGRDNETFSVNLTQALSSGWGSHSLEYGTQVVKSITSGENRQSSTGFNLLSLNADFPASFANGETLFNLRNGGALRWQALPLGGEQEIENLAFYVTDTWTRGKWRVDLGFRYDEIEGTGPLSSQNFSFDKLVPRVGVTYDIGDSWQVQGFWGRYASRFNDNIGQELTGVGSAPRIETFYGGPTMLGITADQVQAAIRNDDNWSFVTDFVDPTQPTRFFDSGLNVPYADDLNLSVRKALPNNSGAVTLTYTDREFNDLIDDFIGGVCTLHSLDFGECPNGDTTTIFDPAGGVLATVDTVVFANNPDARRQYEAITATFNYRPSSRWGIGGNWTTSETSGNYQGEDRNQPASGSILGDFVTSRPEANAAPDGLLNEDIEHRVAAWGTYALDAGYGDVVLGGVFRFQSGNRWSKTAAVPFSDDPLFLTETGGTYTHFFDGRGEEQFDDWWRFDLSARYEFPLFQQLAAWVKVDALNVLDNDDLIGFRTTASAVDQNGTLVWQPAGTCGLNDTPSSTCSSFGRIRNENDYQLPRTFLATIGLRF